jgi:glycosyltransferase involved in cell wall biosynthesis
MTRVVILHYHLRPGGVATVIRNAQRALKKNFDVRVLTDFGYNETPAKSRTAFLADARKWAKKLAAAAKNADVLHAHNLTLGKNPRLSCALKLFAQQGRVKIINQVHDFAEENRPAQLHALRYCTGQCDDNFWREFCYFDAPNMIWATLTTADAAKLAAQGVPSEKIFVLPNPIDDEFFTQPPPSREKSREILQKIAAFARENRYPFDARRKILLSPMKVMRRKNNAEAVELVRRLREYQLIISLDASSPADRAYSEKLKRKIRREKLPVVIGVGREFKNPLPLFHAAHAILTTAKAEGFGYAFVEGWLCGKLVLGRDIPEVTRDFVAEGMDLGHLYREPNDETVQKLAKLLENPPKNLIEHNRNVVLAKYVLRAYAQRFRALLEKFLVGRRLGGGQ